MSDGFADLSALNRQARAVALPPQRPIGYADYCHTITIPDGPLADSRYTPEADPAHHAIMREIASGRWQRIIAVGAVQTGKSLSTVLVPLLRSLTVLRQPCVYSQPTLTKLQEGWAGKLQPSIAKSGYGAWLPDRGQGSKGSQTPKFVTFRDPKTNARAGTLYLIPGGGSSESAQAAVTAAVVAVDEVDSFPSRHRVELVLKRADSYGDKAIRILTSTVKLDGDEGEDASIILAFYRESTETRLHFKCPHCGHWQALEWERVSYSDTDEPAAIASARYTCAGCAVLWTEDDRQRALRDWRCVHSGQQVDQKTGAVIGAEPLTVAFGLLWTGLDSSLRSMGQLAAEHWRATRALAKQDYGPMRSFHRDQLCRPFKDPVGAADITNEGLALVSMASDYDKRVVPHWVTHLVAAVDVQDDRHYWGVAGIGPDDRWCVVDWGYELLVPYANGQATRPPTAADRRRVNVELDAKFNQGWRKEGRDEAMVPIMRGIDVGDGDVTSEIVNWLRGMRGWQAVRGADKEGFKRLGKLIPDLPPEAKAFVELRQPDGWPIYLHNIFSDTVRRWVHASLLRPAYSPASGMLPRGLRSKEPLLLHLSGKVWVAETKKPDGTIIPAHWKEVSGRRHDWLDVFGYALALSRFRAGIQTVAATRSKPKYGRIGTVGPRR
jgi:phage terminase large subunit GpA-like protein